jgi:hypothetical protein
MAAGKSGRAADALDYPLGTSRECILLCKSNLDRQARSSGALFKTERISKANLTLVDLVYD